MSEEQAGAGGGGDDFSGLGGFFFYVFIVHPCTAWILRPGRFPRSKSILYAIAFLAALASIKTGELYIHNLAFCFFFPLRDEVFFVSLRSIGCLGSLRIRTEG